MSSEPQGGSPARARSRGRIFVALVILCVMAAVAYGGVALLRAQLAAEQEPARPAGEGPSLAELVAQPRVLFRSAARRDAGAIGVVALARPDGGRALAPLKCDRVHFAAGQGLCLETQRSVIAATYRALLFDADFQVHHTLPLSGLPSRARLSPDGRYAAMTVFVNGDSYNEQGFSTRTTVVDTGGGQIVADLEQLAVTREGSPFKEVDFNFWGVTFMRDTNRFYATVASANKTYLIQGDLTAKTARTLAENVECPSLSPDNAHLVFKRRLKTGAWQLYLLDTRTMEEKALSAEARSIDDQVEWLDNSHVVYGVREIRSPDSDVTNLWVLPIDGGAPRVLIEGASSAAVVR